MEFGRRAMAGNPADGKEACVLVLTRRRGESVVLPGLGVSFLICETRNDRVRIGVIAPDDVEVFRDELLQRIRPGDPMNRKAVDGSTEGTVDAKE